jgi:hypothetical protein
MAAGENPAPIAQICESANMDNWNAIETAPKDGTCVIISDGNLIAFAFCDPENEFSWTIYDGHDFISLRGSLANPTLWMPAPLL